MSNLPANHQHSAIFARFGEKYGVDGNELSTILKATAFKLPPKKEGQNFVPQVISDEQMVALIIVAEQFKLNPFTREIFAFPDKSKGIVPVVSVDGWDRIVNEHPQLDGFTFNLSENIITIKDAKPCPEWIESVFYRKDRSHPIIIREYLDECYREPFRGDNGYVSKGPWQTHTKRFLRHKAFIQGARMAFGFAGIYDEDEAERIAEARVITAQDTMAAPIEIPSSAPLALTAGEQFEGILLDMGVTGERREMAERYLDECSKHFKADRQYVIEQIVARPDDFRRTFPGWEQSYARLHQPHTQISQTPPTPQGHPHEDVDPVTGEVMEQDSLLTPAAAPVRTKKPQADTIPCPKSSKPVSLSKCPKCPERVGCPSHREEDAAAASGTPPSDL